MLFQLCLVSRLLYLVLICEENNMPPAREHGGGCGGGRFGQEAEDEAQQIVGEGADPIWRITAGVVHWSRRRLAGL